MIILCFRLKDTIHDLKFKLKYLKSREYYLFNLMSGFFVSEESIPSVTMNTPKLLPLVPWPLVSERGYPTKEARGVH